MAEEMLASALTKSTTQDLFAEFENSALQLGYDKIAYVNFSQASQIGYDPTATITYTDEWVCHYAENDFFNEDALFNLAMTNRSPISWDHVRADPDKKLTQVQRRIFDHCQDAGHKFGITMPFHGPGGISATVSVATSGNETEISGPTAQLLGLGAQFHAIFDAIINPPEYVGPPPKVPPRELECLRWVAEGKTSNEIAVITGLTSNTVDTYIKRTMSRLNVYNRVAAVLVASRLGILRF